LLLALAFFCDSRACNFFLLSSSAAAAASSAFFVSSCFKIFNSERRFFSDSCSFATLFNSS
jgi:hypothetical protein